MNRIFQDEKQNQQLPQEILSNPAILSLIPISCLANISDRKMGAEKVKTQVVLFFLSPFFCQPL